MISLYFIFSIRFVEFKSKDDAKKALTEMDRFEVHNRKLVVKEVGMKPDRT